MSSRHLCWLACPLLVVCLQPVAAAQLAQFAGTANESYSMPPAAMSLPSPATLTHLPQTDQRIWSFNFQDAPWNAILRDFSRTMGLSLTMGIDVPGTFTYYDDRKFNLSESIDILNDNLLQRGAILVRNEDRLVLVGTDVPINDNLVPFIPVSEIDSIGRNSVAGAAIPIRGIDPSIALTEVLAMKSSIGQVRAFSNTGRVLVIDTGTHLRRIRDLLLQTGFARSDTASTVYQLRHAKAEDVAKAINDFLSSQNAAGTDPQANQSTNEADRVVAEKTTNCLLVRGSQESMPTIYRLIADLDRFPREVLLQALIVEVQLGNTKEFGVELGFQDSVLFDRSIVNNIQTVNQTATSPNGVQTTNQSILSQSVSPGFNFNGANLGTNAASPGTVGKQGLSNLGAGRINNELGFGGLVLSAGSESVSALLRALDAKFKVDVLSRPQIRTVENKEAFIQVGQQVPVVDGVSVNAVGSANPVVRQDKAGIILKATPRISPDGRVQMDVTTEKSAFLLARGSGVPIFTDAVTGRVIEAPVKDITTATTTVSIQSGSTIVLGGMITSGENVVNRKVPFLGDIPLLGRLFRYDLHQFSRKELLVFLTPVVLHDDLSDCILQDEISHGKITPEAQSYLDRWAQNRVGAPPAMAYNEPNQFDPSQAGAQFYEGYPNNSPAPVLLLSPINQPQTNPSQTYPSQTYPAQTTQPQTTQPQTNPTQFSPISIGQPIQAPVGTTTSRNSPTLAPQNEISLGPTPAQSKISRNVFPLPTPPRNNER